MKLLYIVTLLLVGVNLLLFFANQKEKKTNGKLKIINEERYSLLEEAWGFSLQYSGNAHINLNAWLYDRTGTQKTGDYLKHKHSMLVLRLPQSFCNKCLETELPKLARLSKVIGKNQIVLLSNQANFHEILQLARSKDSTFQVLSLSNTDKLFSDLIEEGNFLFPYFFTLDSTGIVKSVFSTNAAHPELSDSYYRIITKRWEKERDFSQISTTKTQIEFEAKEHDFGNISPGEEAVCLFKFRNTGSVPLFIISTSTGCGCTVADYPLTQVMSGDSASISVRYDAKTPGIFNRQVSVVSNAAKSPTILTIKGLVKP